MLVEVDVVFDVFDVLVEVDVDVVDVLFEVLRIEVPASEHLQPLVDVDVDVLCEFLSKLVPLLFLLFRTFHSNPSLFNK